MSENLPAVPNLTQENLSFAPSDVLNRVLRRWWLLALLTVLGGLAGLGFDRLHPQSYEAGFRILTNIDMATSGELTQYQEDITYEAVGALLFSPSLQQAVAQEAGAEGIVLPDGYFGQNASVERRLATWQVRVRYADPQTAERIATIWMHLASAEIQRAYAQAVAADGLERYLESMEDCLARAAVAPPSYGLCSQANLADIQAEIQQTGALLAEARLSSRGLSSSLSIDQAEMDMIPARVVSNQRGQLVLAGGLVGFLIGLWALQVDLGRLGRRTARE